MAASGTKEDDDEDDRAEAAADAEADADEEAEFDAAAAAAGSVINRRNASLGNRGSNWRSMSDETTIRVQIGH